MYNIIINKTDYDRLVQSIFDDAGNYADEVHDYLTGIWYNIYNAIITGRSRIAFYTVSGINGSTWTHALHKSTRHNGLQMSFYETTADGHIIPTSHSDIFSFSDMDCNVNGVTINYL